MKNRKIRKIKNNILKIILEIHNTFINNHPKSFEPDEYGCIKNNCNVDPTFNIIEIFNNYNKQFENIQYNEFIYYLEEILKEKNIIELLLNDHNLTHKSGKYIGVKNRGISPFLKTGGFKLKINYTFIITLVFIAIGWLVPIMVAIIQHHYK